MLNSKRVTAESPEEYPQKDMPSIMEEHLQNKELCAECGGRCCKNAPCHYSPNDFKDLTFEGLKRVIDQKGYIAIMKIGMYEYDYYKEFCDQYYYYILRIKRHGDSNAFKIEKNSKPTLCCLWTKKGCKLNFNQRPLGAKKLVPKENLRCEQLYSLEQCMREWKPYTKTLRALYRYYKRKKFFDFLKGKRN